MKRIAILGSTGSIGTQALDVIKQHPDQFQAHTLTAGSNAELLIKQAREFKPDTVVIANEDKYATVSQALSDLPIKVYAGPEALCQVVESTQIDMVLTAMVGFAGLRPTIAAIKAGKAIALANKETLVVAGQIISTLCTTHKVPILPVDSEHSAIFQCLNGEACNPIKRILLTASGIIHSAIEFSDGAVIAQLGTPDMRLPIQYAFSFPYRLPLQGKRLNLFEIGTLHFEQPDAQRFPCLQLAYDAIERKGNMPCILNAAGEITNAAFRNERISFLQIPQIIAQAMEQVDFIPQPTLDDLFQTDAITRQITESIISSH